MSRLRTVQIVNVRWFNATVWYGLKVAQLLKEAGHQSHVIALPGTEAFSKAQDMGLHPVGMQLNPKNPLEFPSVLRDMVHFIREVQPHIVNCHRGESFIFWALLKRFGHYGLIRTRGDQRLPRGNWPNRFLHTQAADAVIATNTVMARHFSEKMGVPEEHLYTIFGGVDTRTFHFSPAARKAVRDHFGFTDDHCVLGLLGRFDLVKGQKELIESTARLVNQGLNSVRLLLLGFSSATSQEQVEKWIHETGMEKHILITGKVPDVPACLSALDIGVVASLWSETIARAALEIMACGRPLLSTAVGVMPDLLPAEALIEPNRPEELDRLLAKAIKDLPWRETLTQRCITRMTTLRDEDFLQQTMAVYQKVLRQNSLI